MSSNYPYEQQNYGNSQNQMWESRPSYDTSAGPVQELLNMQRRQLQQGSHVFIVSFLYFPFSFF